MARVPRDRDMMQPVVGFCRNPKCREESHQEFQFFVENDHFECPKCGADSAPLVGVLTLTHLLVPHTIGPVKGSGGRRFVIACDDKRAYLATISNLEAATDNPRVANCPTCLQRAKTVGLTKSRAFIVPGKNPESGEESGPESEPEESYTSPGDPIDDPADDPDEMD